MKTKSPSQLRARGEPDESIKVGQIELTNAPLSYATIKDAKIEDMAPEFTPLLSGPLPAVNPDDIRALRAVGLGPVDTNYLKRCCSPNANVIAVSVRLQMMDMLLEQGVLDRWREADGSPQDRVFEVMASCSLVPDEEKLQLDIPAILKSLEEASH